MGPDTLKSFLILIYDFCCLSESADYFNKTYGPGIGAVADLGFFLLKSVGKAVSGKVF